MFRSASYDRLGRWVEKSLKGSTVLWLWLSAVVLAAPGAAQDATPRVQQRVLQQPQRLEVLQANPRALPPAIAIESIECLPVGGNGVVTAKVTHEPLAARVRVYFRRVSSESDPQREAFYFVNAHSSAGSVYKALLPRPTAESAGSSSSRRQSDRELELRVRAERERLRQAMRSASPPTAAQRRELEARSRRLIEERRELAAAAFQEPGLEPVELRAELLNAEGQEIARSDTIRVSVTENCLAGPHPVDGEALNMTLGETALWQGEEPPFHFECTGIVIREWQGRLFQDPICREYFVPFQPRVQPFFIKSQPVGSAKYRNVIVFFGTDRKRSGRPEASEFYLGGRGPLEVGSCEVTIPASHQVGELEGPGVFERPDPEKHIILLTVTPKPETEFADELAARVAGDEAREVLVFVHGYNVSFADAARRTAQMASDLEFAGAPVMYSWPSQASLAAYPVDEANVRWTVPHLQRFLDVVVERSGAAKVHLIAHSMGNRAVTEALLRYASSRTAGDSPQFNQIVLVAPDVDADVFREDIAPRIRPLGERVTLYASANDKALKVSKGVHGHPRAGDLSSGIVIAESVETIDASNVDTSLLNAIGLGHSYFADKPTVIDDLRLLLSGRSPAARGLISSFAGGRGYWEIRP